MHHRDGSAPIEKCWFCGTCGGGPASAGLAIQLSFILGGIRSRSLGLNQQPELMRQIAARVACSGQSRSRGLLLAGSHHQPHTNRACQQGKQNKTICGISLRLLSDRSWTEITPVAPGNTGQTFSDIPCALHLGPVGGDLSTQRVSESNRCLQRIEDDPCRCSMPLDALGR